MKPFGETDRVQRATIDDVAKLASVSKTTVSRYLSGRYEALAEKTYVRIKQAIEQLDYRPNSMARGLKQDRSYLIGMVIADITNPYSTAILRGAEDVCKRSGYTLMVCNTDNDPLQERDYIFMLQAHRIDGLLINTTGQNNEFLHQLSTERTSIVLVDRKVPELGFDTVGVDNRQGALDAIDHLFVQGYERIALLTEPIAGVSTRTERVKAYQEAIRRHPQELQEDIYEVDLEEPVKLRLALEDFLQKTQGQPRALFATNGVMMLKTIVCLRNLSVSVPEDVALAGFDDVEWAAIVGTGITTVAQPTYEIGQAAMERVLRRIEGDASHPVSIALPGQLQVRGSTPQR